MVPNLHFVVKNPIIIQLTHFNALVVVNENIQKKAAMRAYPYGHVYECTRDENDGF